VQVCHCITFLFTSTLETNVQSITMTPNCPI
jgi:hypothetical protein